MIRKTLIVCLGFAPLLCLKTLAVSPEFWTTSSFRDFSKGKLRGLSLREDGTLSLSRQFDALLDSDQALIWSAVHDRQGNIYVATGHDGKVFKIDESGKSSLFFDATELDVLALALDAKQNLYAATSPDGKVYKITPGGQASAFFDVTDKFIWDLVFDQNGILYVATGGKGKVYKVSPEGEGQELYDTGQTNVTCLAVDAQNHLVAGSDPRGYVYRIAPDGKTFVLFDTGMNEVHDIQVHADGQIYFIAVNGDAGRVIPDVKETTTALPAPDTVSVGLSLSRAQQGQSPLKSRPDPLVAAAAPAKLSKVKSSLHRIRQDQSVETLWSSRGEIAYGLHVDGNGMVFFSSGDKGRIYSLSDKRELTLLIETTEEQTTRLIPAGDELVACTSNLAKIYRLRNQLNRRGSFESQVQDSRVVSRWGMASWQATVPKGTSLKLYTRSGNTQRPDRTWSDWSKAYTRSKGESIQSPGARYIQYKVVMETTSQASPQLTRVVIPYLQRNLPPVVKPIKILPPGVAFLRNAAFSSNPSQISPADREAAEISGAAKAIPKRSAASNRPRRAFQKGSQSFAWKAEDPNGDELHFSVYYRGETESNWKLLVEEHSSFDFTLQSGALPDGRYLIKVLATDGPSNPSSFTKSGESISAPFTIDNTPPLVEVLSQEVQGPTAAVRFRVTDEVSSLRKAEFSTDGGAWKTIFSQDGIIDSRAEEFHVTTEPLTNGEHVVALRAYDATGNVSVGKTMLRVE